jgi:uncharacterized Ntn-hydrolase superfamily protein
MSGTVDRWPSPDGGWTISILARERDSGRLGVAIAASSIAIGARCPLISVGKAVVTSQGFTNLKLGPLAIDLLRRGLASEEVMVALRRHDRWVDFRQIAIVAEDGDIQAHTGAMNQSWAGHRVEGDAVSLGNGLADDAPLAAMSAAYGRHETLPMAERLLAALKQGAAANVMRGVRQGAVSSALLVRAPSDLVQIDLRVDLARASPDEGGDAVADLDRVFKTYLPLVETYERRSMAPEPDLVRATDGEDGAPVHLETQE